jgi:hypothetical protein
MIPRTVSATMNTGIVPARLSTSHPSRKNTMTTPAKSALLDTDDCAGRGAGTRVSASRLRGVVANRGTYRNGRGNVAASLVNEISS